MSNNDELTQRVGNPIRYVVVREITLARLIDTVRYRMRAGWHPIGGVTVAIGTHDLPSVMYLQAMTREIDDGQE